MYDNLYIAKQAASIVTSVVVTRLIKNALLSVTNADDDNLAVIAASSIGGVYVSYKLQDTTNGLVEVAAAKYEDFRNKTNTQQA